MWYNRVSIYSRPRVSAPTTLACGDASMSSSIPQKQCSQCKQYFPETFEYFGRQAMGKNGFKAACKKCTNKQNKEYKYTEAGKQANQRYINGDAGKKTRKKIETKYCENNIEKRHAKREVMNAIRRGDLVPVSSCLCRDCGKQAEHYHHWSYLRQHWLDVIPLCRKCHVKEHAK